MPQGILPFQYKSERTSHQLTGLGGLPLYLDLAHVARLRELIDEQFSGLGPARGWTASQHILAVILLNLAGGDCVDDLDILDSDHGFGEILRQSEVYRFGRRQLRVLGEALANLPEGVKKVYLRSDSAGYQWDLLRYCAEGRDPRFGVIEFAVSCDVTEDFKHAVAEVSEADWHPLWRTVDGRRQATGQQWAEVCFVPNGAGFKKRGPEYRYLAIREALSQLELPGMAAPELPFPVMSMASARYKLSGVVSNRTIAAEELIWWSRERCGESEQAHAVMKDDLAGGQLPSGLFGANAAWWQMMILALNLNAALQRLALGKSWAKKRMKAMRFSLINIPGRVVHHGHRLWVQVAGLGQQLQTLLEARSRILALATGPPG